jgi:hypothetical protein
VDADNFFCWNVCTADLFLYFSIISCWNIYWCNNWEKICKLRENLQLSNIGIIFFIAALVDLLLIVLVYFSFYFNGLILVLGSFVFISAMVRGIVFPMIHHVGANQVKTGAQISNVYFSNVFGSALAPLLISFVALDFLNTQQVYILICFLTLLISAICFNKKEFKFIIFLINIFVFLCLFLPEKLFYELSKNSYELNVYPEKLLKINMGLYKYIILMVIKLFLVQMFMMVNSILIFFIIQMV